ncbi:hypothetical protein D3C80_1162210 [compost metagenome]
MLLVDILQLRMLIAADHVGSDLVVHTGIAELVASGRAFVAAVLGIEPKFFVVGRIALLDPVDFAQAQGQVVDVPGGELGAAECLGKQSAGVRLQQGQVGLQMAHAQFTFGHTRLGGQAQLGVVVMGAPGVARAARLGPGSLGQQAGAGAGGAGVQFQPQHAHGIQADTDRAFGKARLHIQCKALRPLFTPGLTRTLLEVAVEVVVFHLQHGLAVVDQVCLGHDG